MVLCEKFTTADERRIPPMTIIDSFEAGRRLGLAGQPLPPKADPDMVRGYRNGGFEKRVRDTNPIDWIRDRDPD